MTIEQIKEIIAGGNEDEILGVFTVPNAIVVVGRRRERTARLAQYVTFRQLPLFKDYTDEQFDEMFANPAMIEELKDKAKELENASDNN